ncbi:MAG: SUMF1/EgtB/PvdO family nonheme iron enzyme, partial [Candidatus Binatia bacterium]
CVLAFLEQVDFTADHPLLKEGNIFKMLIQHEEQHSETILVILQMLAASRQDVVPSLGIGRPLSQGGIASSRGWIEFARPERNAVESKDAQDRLRHVSGGAEGRILQPQPTGPSTSLTLRSGRTDLELGTERGKETSASGEQGTSFSSLDSMVYVPAGPFLMGSDCVADTLDNERPRHEIFIEEFLIDRSPVTNQEFLQFVAAGGYHTRSCWSPEGWRWREQNDIEHPFYWRARPGGEWIEADFRHLRSLEPAHPVRCVSWYEADAYARFIGKRLPTEAEWEKAASSGYLEQSGQVWEWTTTWFHPYPGFTAYPYEGYSVPYFDHRHKVLKGGSWETRRHALRSTFRNWYHPWVREIFAGFRCVKGL